MKICFDSLSLLPTKGQQALIKTILSDEKESCLKCWQLWKRYQDFEELDYESFILLPFLVEKIDQFDIVDENYPRYQGIMKKNWVENQYQDDIIVIIESIFNDAGIYFFFYDENAIHIRLPNLKYTVKRSRISILIQDKDLSKCKALLENNFWKLTENSFYQKLFSKINFIQFEKDNHRLTIYFQATRIPSTQTFNSSIFSLKKEEDTSLIIDDTLYIYLLLLRSQTEYYIAKITWIIFCSHSQKNSQTIDWDEFVKIVIKNKTAHFILPAYQVLHSINPEIFPILVINELTKIPSHIISKLEFKFIASKKKILRKIYYCSIYYLKKGILFYNK